MKHHRRYILPLLIAALALGFAQTSFALTHAGIQIDNIATVTYSVNGESASDTTATAASFIVDSLIDLNVAGAAAGYVSTSLGLDKTAAMKFTITNTGNEDLFTINLTVNDSTTDSVGGGADNLTLDTTPGYSIFIDDGDGIYNSTLDTEVAGAGTATISSIGYDDGGSSNYNVVFVVPDIPTASNGQTLGVTLLATATAYNSAAEAIPVTTGAPTQSVRDLYRNDVAGPDGADGAGDAKHSAAGTWQVSIQSVSITKSAATATGFYLPGDFVTYTILLDNAWASSVTGVTVVDEIPPGTAFVCGSITGAAGSLVDVHGNQSFGDACDAGDGVADTDVTHIQFTVNNLGANGSGSDTASVDFKVQIQ